MKRVCSLTLLLTSVAYLLAQPIQPNDSVTLGTGNADMVFYSLQNGTKTVSSNTDWHLAITVRATQFPNSPLGGTTIRINEANGVSCYYVPNASVAQINNVDTTGYESWTKLHDSDSLMDEGALNSNRSTNIFDFGWGVYNSVTHNVTGDSLYLIKLPDGSLKKFYVEDLLYDTAFVIKYSNIDNSNPQTVTFAKKTYQGKNFVYLNMLTNQLLDKEPLSATWDLHFLTYAATDVVPNNVYPVTGVWLNRGVAATKRQDVEVSSYDFTGLTPSTDMSAIGWNWKSFNQSTGTYDIQDSLTYLISRGPQSYKLVFTGYSGSSTGVISFYTEPFGATGVSNVADESFSLYPNPANDYVTIAAQPGSRLMVSNLQGAVVHERVLTQATEVLPTATWPAGVFLLTLQNNTYITTQKIVVRH